MQCKDIPDEEFLDAVRTCIQLRGGIWANRWDVTAVLSGYPELVNTPNIWPALEGDLLLPANLIRAKARKLILKGKMTGCPCGCRGDFEPIKGEQSEETD